MILNDVFWYRGRPYVTWILPGQAEFVVEEPQSHMGHGFYASPICQMQGVRRGH